MQSTERRFAWTRNSHLLHRISPLAYSAARREASVSRQGIVPLSTRSSRLCLSFSVSIGRQKPSCLMAMSWSASISRRNGASTSSSPSRHVVEDLLSEDEEAAIDPEIGVLAAAQTRRPSRSADVHQMQAERRPDGQEAGDLAARPEQLSHLLQIRVGETVAVVGVEHLLAGDVLAHGPEALPDVAPDAGVDHRDAPVLLRIAEDLDFLAEARDDAVGVGLRLVVQEEFLDDVGLVAKAQHEILVPELAVVVHQMPQDRLVADRDHRLRHALGDVSDPRAQTSAEKNRFHRLRLSLPVARCRAARRVANANSCSAQHAS